MHSNSPDPPPVLLDDALSKPIYSLEAPVDSEDDGDEDGEPKDASMGPQRKLQACILCIDKVFKNDKMVSDHLESKVSRISLLQAPLDPDR